MTSMSSGTQLLIHSLWTLWCLFWGVLIVSACMSVVQTIFSAVRFTHRKLGGQGMAIFIAVLVIASAITSGLVAILLGLICLGGGGLYYFLDFWLLRFPHYFQKWRTLPLATRIMSLAFPYDLVFSLLKSMDGY